MHPDGSVLRALIVLAGEKQKHHRQWRAFWASQTLPISFLFISRYQHSSQSSHRPYEWRWDVQKQSRSVNHRIVYTFEFLFAFLNLLHRFRDSPHSDASLNDCVTLVAEQSGDSEFLFSLNNGALPLWVPESTCLYTLSITATCFCIETL